MNFNSSLSSEHTYLSLGYQYVLNTSRDPVLFNCSLLCCQFCQLTAFTHFILISLSSRKCISNVFISYTCTDHLSSENWSQDKFHTTHPNKAVVTKLWIVTHPGGSQPDFFVCFQRVMERSDNKGHYPKKLRSA